MLQSKFKLIISLEEANLPDYIHGAILTQHPGSHLVTEHVGRPLASVSTMIRFLESCSWIRMTFSVPRMMK